MQSESEVGWISLNETARLLGVSRTMINLWRGQGDFPAPIFVGERRISFVRAEILAWMARRQASRTGEDRIGKGRVAGPQVAAA